MYRRQSQMTRRKQKECEWLQAERRRQELAWRKEKIYNYFNAAIKRPEYFPDLSRVIVGIVCTERQGGKTPNKDDYATQAMMCELMSLPQRCANLEVQIRALELQLQEERRRRELVEQYVYVSLLALVKVVRELRGAPHI